MIYEKMPFGKFKGTPLNELHSNYIVHAIETFVLPNELKNQLKQIIAGRLGLCPDKKEHHILLVDDEGANDIYPEILPSVGSYFFHEYGLYKMSNGNLAHREVGQRYTQLYEKLVYLGFQPNLSASGLIEITDNIGGYFNYEDYEFKGVKMEDFKIHSLVESFNNKEQTVDFYCEWVDKFTIQIAY